MDPFGVDEDDRESGGSPEGSSDNDQMEDRDDEDLDNGPGDNDGEADGDNDDENEDEDEDQDQDDSQDSVDGQQGPKQTPASQASLLSTGSLQAVQGSSSSAPTSVPNPSMLLTSPSPTQESSTSNSHIAELPKVRPEVLTASVYDIVPTIAAPHSTSINSVTATPDLRWVFSGGADGYIRKFNWLETANGKTMLTVAQRHPFVESVTKAGVLMSYWENEDEIAGKTSEYAASISPVYSLATQREGLWLLSGLDSGAINLQSIRHDEGKKIASLKEHRSAVSVLNLAQDEMSVLSGSWDKTIIDWDLNNGKVVRRFEGGGSQISAIETRPMSSLHVPEASGEIVQLSGTFSSDSDAKPSLKGTDLNGVNDETSFDLFDGNPINGDAASPNDSLFGGNDADSLFGDTEAPSAPPGNNFGVDDDDDFSRAIVNGMTEQEEQRNQEKANRDGEGDFIMPDIDDLASAAPIDGTMANQDVSSVESPEKQKAKTEDSASPNTLTNGLPHADEPLKSGEGSDSNMAIPEEAAPSSDSTFLAAAIDGSLRIWDKRQPAPIAKIVPQNVPPWCMHACWSPDGNFIYAGRRNGTVDEYSLHKGLRGPERSFKLPNNSGPVSAVRAMPNGRHLICASYDILRLYDLHEQQIFKHATVPFLIIPGHRTGVVSHLYMDPTCRYLISAAGNRGWEGASTEVLLGYEIGVPK